MLRTCRMLCSQAGPSPGGWQPLSFDGGAFHLKGTGELTRALLVLRLCAWPPLVTHGLALQAWSRRLLGSRLSGALLRASIYGQFVAGETAEEVRGCVLQLQTLGLRPLLAVPIEEEPDSAVKTGEAWYEGNLSTMLRCVDLSRGLLETPDPMGNALMQLKMTALMSTRLCKELASWVRRPGESLELSPERLAEAMDSGQDLRVSCLNTEQTRHLQASLSRLQRVVQHARAQRVRLLVDAEYTSLNPALSLLVAALATRWNSSREGGPWVWNTYQAYLKDTYEQLRRDAEAADRAGLAFGVKLLQPLSGADADPSVPTWPHVPPHGQAGYAVYKSIPYGSLEEVIPYLIRRAQENRSVLRGARREQELLSQELRRRLLGPGLRVSPH
ncbi:PRODH2 [Cervus elaphus hippelaphus]|uniref:Proline dehydrogenase n=1 Tax=Cervus elaphus hippelaphus TaxID=46360 RepID=A0A212DE76_CEREH|nr:PRODH2 [Cervus elaphus hippelaphus]